MNTFKSVPTGCLLAGAVLYLFCLPHLSLTYLDTDEVMHYTIATASSVEEFWGSLRWQAHPPLFFLQLRGWAAVFGKTEFALRLLPWTLGAAAGLLTYFWSRAKIGTEGAAIAALALASAPPFVAVSEVIRSYSAFVVASLIALRYRDRFFQNPRPARALTWGLSICLVLSTHYNAFPVVLAVGIHDAYRLWKQGDRRTARLWLLAHVAPALEALWLYRTHLSVLQGSGMRQDVITRWHPTLYLNTAREGVLGFLARSHWEWFQYYAHGPWPGLAALLLFWWGIYLLHRRAGNPLFYTLPFLVSALFAVGGILPFGGSRHSSYLLLFAAPPLAVALRELGRGLGKWIPIPGLLIFFTVCAAEFAIASRVVPTLAALPLEFAQPRFIAGAGDYLRRHLRPGEPVVTDLSTNTLARFYFPGEITYFPTGENSGHVQTIKHEGHEFLGIAPWEWELPPLCAWLKTYAAQTPDAHHLWFALAGVWNRWSMSQRTVENLPEAWWTEKWTEGNIWLGKFELDRFRKGSAGTHSNKASCDFSSP